MGEFQHFVVLACQFCIIDVLRHKEFGSPARFLYHFLQLGVTIHKEGGVDRFITEGGFAFIGQDIHLLVGRQVGLLLASVKCVKGFFLPMLNEVDPGKHPVNMGAVDIRQIMVLVINGLFAQFLSPIVHTHF